MVRRLLLALLALAVTFPLASSAPVPKAKPVPAKPPMLTAKDLAGDWQLDWNGSSDQPCWLHADGRWNCLWFGTPWSGTWTLAKGVLTVVEGTAGNPPSLTWTVPVGANLGNEATLTGGSKVAFGLRRKVPGKPDA